LAKAKYTKISEGIIGRMAGLLSAGLPIRTACSRARLNKSTFFKWRAQGEADHEAGEDTLYAKFFLETDDARAESEESFLGYIREAAARGNWQAAAWYLERTRPADYARLKPADLSERDEDAPKDTGPAIIIQAPK